MSVQEAVQTGAVLLVLIYSIILHEVAHGAVAFLNGDPTAKAMKRLTLNPLRHADLLGTVILPLALFFAHSPFLLGWAKPVPYNPAYFKNQSIGTFTVGIAGVAVNLLLALLFSLCLNHMPPSEWSSVFSYGVSINLILAIFNLIPIPPLDGSRVVASLLPPTLRRAFLSVDKIGIVLIMVLLYFGVISKWIMPVHNFLYEWFRLL